MPPPGLDLAPRPDQGRDPALAPDRGPDPDPDPDRVLAGAAASPVVAPAVVAASPRVVPVAEPVRWGRAVERPVAAAKPVA